MKVVVGSTNPVKIDATKRAFSRFFEDVEVQGISVSSDVSDMPASRDETKKGAINRAHNALFGADFAVGLEGGVHENHEGMYLIGTVAVLHKEGKLGLSNAEGFLLPNHIAERVRAGEELGPLLDNVLGTNDIKKKGGAIGHFTRGHVTRTDAFERAIIYALVPFINEDFYGT